MFLFRRSKNALRSVTMKPDLKISKIDKTVYKLLNWLVAMTQMKPQTKEYHKEGNDNNAYTHTIWSTCVGLCTWIALFACASSSKGSINTLFR